MPNDPSIEPDPAEPAAPPAYAPLQAAFIRAVSSPPWWRRWWSRSAGAGSRRHPAVRGAAEASRRGAFPVMAALGAVLMLSIIGVAAPWNSNPTPARGGGALDDDRPVLLDPTPVPVNPQPPPGHGAAGQTLPTPEPAAGPGAGEPCPAPLSVIASPDIALAVWEAAGTLATGSCPGIEVSSQESAATLRSLANGGPAPDVWIPSSTLWLRRATAGSGSDLPASGTSVATSPVVLAVPEPVADDLASQGAWPVWLVFYDLVTGGEIPRMSMADLDTTAGALTLVAFSEAAHYHWSDANGGGFLHMLHFRESLASTAADPDGLFDRLDSVTPAQSVRQVGVFPTTEQRLLVHNEGRPRAPMVAYGTHEAMSEADYPMAIAGTLDDRLAAIADELRAQLRSPAAIQLLVDEGYRPPRGVSTRPAALDDTGRFPDYPDPVPLPDAAGWRELVDGWTWTA